MVTGNSGSESQDVSSSSRALWPLLGTAAAITGLVATLFGDVHVNGNDMATSAVVPDISSGTAHLSVIFGYLTVALLLVLAGAWRHHAEAAWQHLAAPKVVSNGIIATAGGLSLGYGWKGALAIYARGGNEHGAFDDAGLYIYYVLNDFGSFIPYLGVVVAAGAFAWLGLRDRVIPLWIGAFSVLPVLGTVALAIATGLPGFPALMGVPWMAVAFTGLYIARVKAPAGRLAATRQADPAPAV
jgi:hypothetical protein